MANFDVNLGELGPFPFRDCPVCERNWPEASYRGIELCFECAR